MFVGACSNMRAVGAKSLRFYGVDVMRQRMRCAAYVIEAAERLARTSTRPKDLPAILPDSHPPPRRCR